MILYRLARLDGWSGKYRFNGYTLDQGQMQAQAHEIYQVAQYFEKPYTPEWLVIGATTTERLEWMLKRLNEGKTSCSARLSSFLSGMMSEDHVRGVEDDIARDAKRDEYLAQQAYYNHTYNPDVSGIVSRALDQAMGRVFKNEAPDPSPRPSNEEGEPKPFTEEEMKLIKSVRWSKQVRARLKFMRFLKERGVFDDDLVSAEV